MNKDILTRFVTCWRIQLSSGQVLCFTDADQDICFDNEIYVCGGYFTPSKITNSNELAQDDFTIMGVIDNHIIKKEALLAGDFSNSYLEVFLIDSSYSERKNILKTGWLGEIKCNANNFTAKVCSLGSKTNNLIGKCYSSSCRARFGDQYCKMNVENYTFSGEVTNLTEENSFIDELRQEPDDYFTAGVLTFELDDNRRYTVKEFRENKVVLDFVRNLKINIGDKYTITVGCDKSLHSCINKFDNVLNFRGEPYIPSRHQLVVS